MKTLRCAVCVAGAVVVLLGGSLAQAGLTVMHEVTDSYNRDFAQLFTGTGSASMRKALSLGLPQFDPSLGKLTGVNIMFNRTAASEGMIKTTNTSTTETMAFDYSASGSFQSPEYPGMIPGPVGGGGGKETLGPGAMLTKSFGTAFELGFNVDIDPADFVAYIGAGTVAPTNSPSGTATVRVQLLDPLDLIDPEIDPTDELVTEGGLSFAVRAKVTYMYEVVPEPVSAALGLMGLGALGVATRRRVG